jgi:hypothetical protein
MLVIWKLRESPLRLISKGFSPTTFSPLSSIVPEVIGRRALIRWNSVDLPAPLGPMMAWRSPRWMSRSTPRMISLAPKFFFSP